jgi:hypothetical protein
MKRIPAVKRAVAVLVGLGLLMTIAVTPALAIKKGGGGGGGSPHAATSPYLELGMCKDSLSSDFIVNVYWGNQTPGPANLDIVVTFKASGGRMAQAGEGVAAPVAATGVASFHIPQFTDANGGIVDWNNWTQVSAVSAGAFDGTASAVHEPHAGWGTCFFT